jgi:hypothetical protein
LKSAKAEVTKGKIRSQWDDERDRSKNPLICQVHHDFYEVITYL